MRLSSKSVVFREISLTPLTLSPSHSCCSWPRNSGLWRKFSITKQLKGAVVTNTSSSFCLDTFRPILLQHYHQMCQRSWDTCKNYTFVHLLLQLLKVCFPCLHSPRSPSQRSSHPRSPGMESRSRIDPTSVSCDHNSLSLSLVWFWAFCLSSK